MKYSKVIASILATLGILMPVTAFAAEFMAPPREGSGSIVAPASETKRNLYIVGGSVTVDSNIEGDVYAAGSTVTINGPVSQDVVAAGGTVVINSPVAGDVRVAGGTVQINAPIAGDLLMAGGTVNVSSKSNIGRDLIVGAGDLHLDAVVNGGVRAAGGDLAFNSEVKGDMYLASQDQVAFGPNSRVGGKAIFKLKNDPRIDGAAVFASSPEISKMNQRSAGDAGKAILGGLWIKLLAAILSALVFVWLFPGFVKSVLDKARQTTATSLGIGVLLAISLPILAILTFVVLIGYKIGFLIMAVYFATWFLASILGGIGLGAWLMTLLSSRKEAWGHEWKVDWQAAVLGAAVLSLISLIPVVGWVICALVSLTAFGTIMRLLWEKRGA